MYPDTLLVRGHHYFSVDVEVKTDVLSLQMSLGSAVAHKIRVGYPALSRV